MGMWRDFGGNCFGVCIQTTTSRLQNSLKQNESHLHTKVAQATYTDDAISTLFSSAPFFRKDRQFQNEKEFRVLAQIRMEYLPKEPGTEFLAEAPEFQLVEVDLGKLLDNVVVGSKVLDTDFIFLKTWIQTLCPSAAICRSAIGATSL